MPIIGTIASSYRSATGGDTGSIFPIASIIVPSGGSGSVTFSSIPTTYTHLQIRGVAKSNRNVYVDDVALRFNSDTASNYSWHRLYGFGNSGNQGADAGNTQTQMNILQVAGGTVNQSTGFGGFTIDILDYKSTVKTKTARAVSGYDDNGQGAIQLGSGAWYNSATAVSSVTLLPLIGTLFAQHSYFSLYGVK